LIRHNSPGQPLFLAIACQLLRSSLTPVAKTEVITADKAGSAFFSEQKDKNVILVVNKNDIAPVSAEKAEYLESVSQGFFAIVSISAKSGDGKDQLSEKINELYPAGDDLLSAGLVITGARIYAAVNGAYNAVCEGLCTLEGYTQDLAGTDIERAISCLSEADGRKVTEEIVDNIFSRFCVGK